MIDSLKQNLDCRICHCEEGANNTMTYREFMRFTEKFFKLDKADIDSMSEEELNNYLDFLDELYIK